MFVCVNETTPNNKKKLNENMEGGVSSLHLKMLITSVTSEYWSSVWLGMNNKWQMIWERGCLQLNG